MDLVSLEQIEKDVQIVKFCGNKVVQIITISISGRIGTYNIS